MEIKINIKYLPLKALKVYNVHIHIGRKPVLKLHWRLTADVRQPWTNPQHCYFECLIIRFDYSF